MLLHFVFVVAFCVLFKAQATLCIQCNKCHSKVSWDECIKFQEAVNCSSIFNRCLTFHKILTGPNGKTQHEYQKDCYHDTSCRSLECKNSQCNMECCNTTMCNDGITKLSNEIPILSPKDNEIKHHKKQKENAKKKPLECYLCSSAHSWEDCHKKQKLDKCPEQLNVCTTYHLVLTLPSGNQEHKYNKGCWHDKECSNERCRLTDVEVKGTWCDMRCCNSTKCNRGGIQRNTGSVALQVIDSANAAAKLNQLSILTAMVILVQLVSGTYI
ncbi:uncharacterized protein LOC110240036 [Exaiptasia diaphana]|uniref:UPAR/Ly6 domain-containing protein n=1 Tax=Exaiptasia diaphana TaxID=2652724 RepID=A0A913XA68_EXADI|nr:uncharacterized protein LOC110240036 [Exaiptasia diaphana]KXJ26580.1 hypothetical protein AC249_AIPGENE8310 [Exaiptasia diaphana]